MNNKIKRAFDPICVEPSLAEHTLRQIRDKSQTQAKPWLYLPIRQLAAMAISAVLVLSSGLFAHSLYFTKAAYIDFDINPSLELTINRLDRVIAVEAYNDDGAVLLDNLSLKHKKVDAAIDELIATAANTDFLQGEGLVSVTVQSLSGDDALLPAMEAEVASSVAHHSGAQVHVFSVDSETRNAAHGLRISPAKYLAILDLQAADPNVTIEECRNHTIGEIQQRTQNHGGMHGGKSRGGHGHGRFQE